LGTRAGINKFKKWKYFVSYFLFYFKNKIQFFAEIPDLDKFFLKKLLLLLLIFFPLNVSNLDFKVCLGGSFCSQFFILFIYLFKILN
jgi:hypothetical protein